MLDLKGICPIVATPFTQNGEVEYESFVNLLRELIRGGCHGLTLFGIAGEYYKLNDDERAKMAGIMIKECKEARIPSIISVTQHSSEIAAERAAFYENAGADCLMLLPPFFLKPGARDLCLHMKTVAKAVKIPVMIQYAPEQTNVPVDPKVFEELTKEHKNVCYYKIECKPPGAYITRLLSDTENKVAVFVGNAGFQMLEALDRGAVGVCPGCSMYDVYLDIYNNYIQGKRKEATQGHNALLPMLNHIRQNVEMIIYYEKRILKKRGIIETDYCRQPTFTPDKYHDYLFEEYYEKLAPYFKGRRA